VIKAKKEEPLDTGAQGGWSWDWARRQPARGGLRGSAADSRF